MRRKQRNELSGADLLRVFKIHDKNSAVDPSSPFVYNILIINSNTTECSNRQIYVIPPRTPLDKDMLKRSTGFQIAFREELLLMLGCDHFSPFATSTAASPVSYAEVNNTKMAGDLDSLIVKMISISHQPEKQRMSLIYGLTKVFLVYISRYFTNKKTQDIWEENNLYSQFVNLLNKDQFEKRAVNDYASALSVSANTLCCAIRKMSGFTASQHIQQRTIHKAKQAAITSHASMKEVAFNLGFQDIAHFSKYFRMNAGMTFTDFKRTFQIQ